MYVYVVLSMYVCMYVCVYIYVHTPYICYVYTGEW